MLALPILALSILQPPSPPTAPTPSTPPSNPTPLTIPVPPVAAAQEITPDALKGKWKGAIDLPGGAGTLGFLLTVTGPESATIAIPDQGLAETPLSGVAISPDSMKFKLVIPNAPAEACPVWNFQPAADALSAKGTMLQSGMTLTASLKKLDAGDDGRPKRPQTPKAPFPYTTRDVSYASFDGAAINGTLTIPQIPREGGHAPLPPGQTLHVFPCALFITGSGTQDRDETLFDHKPFAVIADALARAGIASLRVDDRGWNGAKDPLGGDGTSETFARDAAAGIEFLLQQPEIAANRIGLIGHSEGGLIAPAVAAAKPDHISFMVLLAGTGVTGHEVLERQLAAILTAQGATPQQVFDAAARQRSTLTAAAAGNEAAARQSITDAIRASDPQGTLSGPAFDTAVDNAMKQTFSPWMRHFLTRDPRPDLRTTRCPVLVLNGGRDVQVVAAQNVPQIVASILDGGNTNVTARVFPNLNHLFQPATTGAVDEYARIESTIDPAVLEAITEWIRRVAKP